MTTEERIKKMTEDSAKSVVKSLVEELLAEADQLDRWACESEKGGWSTHQVGPMRERASKIRAKLIHLGL